jgi:TPR repeat protein
MRKILLALFVAVTVQAGDLTNAMEALEKGDFKSAVLFFQKAATAGDKMAQQNLAVMYNNGYGVKKDTQLASMWLNRATNKEIVVLR